MSFQSPCTRSTSPSCIFSLPKFCSRYSRFRRMPRTLTLNLSRKSTSFTVRLISRDDDISITSAIPIS